MAAAAVALAAGTVAFDESSVVAAPAAVVGT